MKKPRVPSRQVPQPVQPTSQTVQPERLTAVRGGTGNKIWQDDWLAPI